MADYDDAESPVGEREAPSRSPRRATGPIAKAMAWFGAQPATTKVIVIGVIVVLGVVVYMAFKKTPAASTDTSAADNKSGPGELPKGPPGGPNPPVYFPPQPIPLGGGFQPGPQPPVTQPGQNGPTGIATQPAAAPAVARWMVTPGGVSDAYANYNVNNAGHRQGIAITGKLS